MPVHRVEYAPRVAELDLRRDSPVVERDHIHIGRRNGQGEHASPERDRRVNPDRGVESINRRLAGEEDDFVRQQGELAQRRRRVRRAERHQAQRGGPVGDEAEVEVGAEAGEDEGA